ncbi:hypothetical protein OIO90_002003 [Microbotryomycetes sp. JL221]|nr:hypothetical protein OIO90_002003 [Microbotryomycetes sp. JL221]
MTTPATRTASGSTSASTSWQHVILTRLQQRDVRDQSMAGFVAEYERAIIVASQLKQTNQNLLHAATTTLGDPRQQPRVDLAPLSPAVGPASRRDQGSSASTTSATSTVHSAYISSLEIQLSDTKQELSEQYKVQSANAQRLLLLTDQLREFELRERRDKDLSSKIQVELESLRERQTWLRQTVDEKEKQIVILQDEIQSLELELEQLSLQNRNLKTDNASLLQRWLELKNQEASRMNDLFVSETTRLTSKASSSTLGADASASKTTTVAATPKRPEIVRKKTIESEASTSTKKSNMINSRILSKPSQSSLKATPSSANKTSADKINRLRSSDTMTQSTILDPTRKPKSLASSSSLTRSTTSLNSVTTSDNKGKSRLTSE